jgi:hypothetical protein
MLIQKSHIKLFAFESAGKETEPGWCPVQRRLDLYEIFQTAYSNGILAQLSFLHGHFKIQKQTALRIEDIMIGISKYVGNRILM